MDTVYVTSSGKSIKSAWSDSLPYLSAVAMSDSEMKYFERKDDYSLNCVFVLLYCLVLSLMDRKTERAFQVLKRELRSEEERNVHDLI